MGKVPAQKSSVIEGAQYLALIVTFCELIFVVLSCFIPWQAANTVATDGSNQYKFDVDQYPVNFLGCKTNITPQQQTSFSNGISCFWISGSQLSSNFSYFYKAGSVALAMLITCIPLTFTAFLIQLYRVTGTMHRVIERAAVLKKPITWALIQLAVSALSVVAWAVYAGLTSVNFNMATLQQLLVNTFFSGSTTVTWSSSNWNFGGGFALTIITTVFAFGSAVYMWFAVQLGWVADDSAVKPAVLSPGAAAPVLASPGAATLTSPVRLVPVALTPAGSVVAADAAATSPASPATPAPAASPAASPAPTPAAAI